MKRRGNNPKRANALLATVCILVFAGCPTGFDKERKAGLKACMKPVEANAEAFEWYKNCVIHSSKYSMIGCCRTAVEIFKLEVENETTGH